MSDKMLDRPRYPSMLDVGRRAGVTPMTVSRALRDPAKLAPETLQRVRAAIKELGYVPNSLAGALSAKRSSKIVAALIPSLQHQIFADMVTGLTDALRRDVYHLVLGATGYLPAEEDMLVETFLGRRPDAFLLTGTIHSRRSVDRLSRTGMPIVETWELTQRPIDMVVGFSNEAAAHAMTLRLAACGYRHIAYVSGPTRVDDRARPQEQGYRRALAELGYPVLPIRSLGKPTAPRLEEGGRLLRDVLEMSPRPDAIFFSSDIYAVGALIEARRLGIAIPEQIGIAGFHDLEIGRLVDPPLTTVHVPSYEIGLLAGQNIAARLAGKPAAPETTVPFVVVERGSTRARASVES